MRSPIRFHLSPIRLLWVWFVILLAAPCSAAMNDYCSTPPFMSNSVPPNVLIVLDNSGSMQFQAYESAYDPSQFVGGHYYGYFKPDLNYRYTGTSWEPTAADFSTATTSNPIASGDFLNWATMRRIEVAKKLLIGGKAAPRSPQPSQTVKLIRETPGSARDFSKIFDNAGAPGLIAPFSGEHRYKMSSDTLSISPLVSGSTSYVTRPRANLSVAASWTVSGSGEAWSKVDEASQDGDSSYIRNSSKANEAALFDYDYSDAKTGTIDSVTVRVVAKKSSKQTRRIQGVLRIDGANYAAANLNLGTSYNTYDFTFTTNPATGLPWQWSEIKSSGVGSLQGFGVQAATTPTSGNHVTVTQVYLQISASTPSGSYKTEVDYGMEKAEGLIDRLSANARFGLAHYNLGSGYEQSPPTSNGKYDGGNIANYIDFAAPVNMITSIHNLDPDTWTPLAETLFEMVRYFRQEAPYYSGNSPADYQTGTNYDPYYFQYSKVGGSNLPDQYVRCAKSFILMLTDGESTMDKNLPDWLKNYAGDGNTFGTDHASDYLKDVALWARTTDHRPSLDGMQNIVFYPVYMFGRGSDVLKKSSINGGFSDLNGDGNPGPALAEYLRDSDEDGAITSADLPLTYYEGDDGYQLESSITEAIASILKRAASGTAVSVLTTSSRGVGSMVQAYFLPIKQEGLREVAWTGYTQNLWIDPEDNLREDTVNDLQLKLNSSTGPDGDRVVKLYFDPATAETKAALFTTDDQGGGGSLAACTTNETKPFGEITYIWEAGKQLTLQPAASRTLFTAKKVISTAGTTTISNNIFNSPLDATVSAALDADATYSATNIVNYIRGEAVEESNPSFRDRRLTVNGALRPWKLGDIISSTPKVFANTPQNAYHIDYGDNTYFHYIMGSAYKDRSSIAVVGANDGVLHAFRVGYLIDKGLGAGIKAKLQNFISGDTGTDKLGQEIWGYIPYNSLPYLKYLARPDYCHIYFNDLSVRLVDASVGDASADAGTFPAANRTISSWRTILIGGMRFGGACAGGAPTPPLASAGFSSYYAIDITDPENPVPLWEFSDADLGYTTSAPAIIRTGGNQKNGRWYVAFGSGSKQLPKNNTDIGRSTTGYLYILDLKSGAVAQKINLGHNAIVGDVLSVDANRDYISEWVYFGTAYKDSSWKGKLMTVAIPDGNLSDNAWTPVVSTLFGDVYPFTASPDASRDTFNNIWLYAGSGKYYSDLDEVDSSNQVILGLKHIRDTTPSPAYPWNLTNLDNQSAVVTRGTVTGTTTVCSYDSGSGFANRKLVTSIDQTAGAVTEPARGWYQVLTNGERVISRPLAVGGLVDILTYKPNTDPCSFGGDSYLYALGYTTGTAPSKIAIRAPETTYNVMAGEVTVAKGIKLGPGAPPTGEAIIIPPPKEGQETLKKKIQIATGVVVEAENMPVLSTISKIVHWIRK